MIQDIGEHIYDNHFEPHEAGPGSYLLHYVGDTMLCKLDDGGFCLPRLADLASAPSLRYLFSIDGTGFFLILDETVDAPGFSYAPVNWTRDAEPRHLLFAAVTGWQLARWYEANRFCGRCGHPTEIVPTSREICCPECGMVIYPKIAPGVIVAIIDPATERIVLTKYAGRPQVHYALVAGFTEIGESIEQTVAREVMEEVRHAARGLLLRGRRIHRDHGRPQRAQGRRVVHARGCAPARERSREPDRRDDPTLQGTRKCCAQPVMAACISLARAVSRYNEQVIHQTIREEPSS